MNSAPTPYQRPFRLLRSMLFVPATVPHFFAKAAAGEADGIIIDLEDAVAPERKDEARAAAVEALNSVDWGAKQMAVRVNGLESAHTYRDVIALAEQCPRLDQIVLPMVNSADDVRFVATLLDQAAQRVPHERLIGIEGIIETPLGMERIGEIAQAAPRLEALSFGAGDYAAAMGMRDRRIGAADPDYALLEAGVNGAGVNGAGIDGAGVESRAPRLHYGDKWHWAMARLANACHAYGLRPRDSAYADFRDVEGYRAACRRAVALGFVGKSAIHPSQVALANEAFSPTPEQVAWARALIETMERSVAAGQGASAMGGEMIDLANVRLAEQILAITERIAAI